MKILKKMGLWIILTCVFAVLLIVAIIGTAVTNYFAPAINSLLNADTSRIVKVDGDTTDTEYFKSNYTYDKPGEEKLVKDGKDLYRNIIEEGTTLLKNENNALPFKSTDKKITVFGNAGPQYITAFNTKLTEAGFTVDGAVWNVYNAAKSTARKKVNLAAWSTVPATEGDVAIVTLGRRAGEGTDCAHPNGWALNSADAIEFPNGDYLDIATSEIAMMQGVKALKDAGKFSKIIVIVNTSNMINGDFINDPAYGIDAVLWMGQASQDYGTEGLVNILKGSVNPSGRLVDTIYMNNLDNPVMKNYGAVDGDLSGATASLITEVKTENYIYNDNAQGNDWDDSVVYQEGIYLGYKYYETRYEDFVMGTAKTGDFSYSDYVAYPFGHGLSYTNWSYSNYKVNKDGGEFKISVDVKNEGDVAGKHSVLVYLQKPYTSYAKANGIEQSAVNLVGFGKTENAVDGGKSTTVSITIPEWQLRTYDSNKAKTYILDAGSYYFTVAGSSHEATNNILAKKSFAKSGGKMDADGAAANVYEYKVNSLDTNIFSKSYSTGVAVENMFDVADLNRDETAHKTNTITYVSRSDWSGTLPTETYRVKYNDGMVNQARSITYKKNEEEQKNTPMPKFGVKNGLTLAMFMDTPYEDKMWYKLLEQMTYEETAALVMDCWYGSRAMASVGKLAQTDQDSSMGRVNPFVATKLSGTNFPSGDMRAATFNAKLMKDVGLIQGEQNLHSSTAVTKSIGLYGFSPNIHRSPYSGRNGEYFSEDAYITGMACGYAISGMQEKGSVCFAKHYFLNDQEDHRHGIATWANEQTLRETYLPGFEYGITMFGGMGLMNSFNRIGMLWPGEHYGSQLGFLYNELGFEGNIVTDMYEVDHQDVIDGLLAHTTMWLHTTLNPYSYGLLTSDEYRNDPVIVTALVEAAHRMLYGSSRSAAMNGLSANAKVVQIMPWWQVAIMSFLIVCAILTVAAIALLVVSIVLKRRDRK